MQTIKLKNILNQEDKEYFSEICVHLGYDNQEVSSFLPANLRCRMLFDCLVDFRKKNEDGSEGPWERGQENISIVIPSASEMIDLILGRTDEAYPSNLTVSVDLWKSLLYYCQVFLGVMKNSPIQFSLSNADSASKNFDRFEEYLNWIVSGGDDDKGERGMAVISTHLNSTDVYQQERSLHLTLTQEIMNENQNSPYWTGGLKLGRVAVGFLPLPAVINKDLPKKDKEGNPIIFNPDGIMLFYEESGLLGEDTTLITGTLNTFIPCSLPQWQKEDSMTPDIMNPKFTYRGIREGDLLDQSTINGFFNRVTNTIQGLFTKAATHASVLTSLLVMIKKFSVRLRANEFAITALQDFNPVGCIVQFIGNMSFEQEQYYQLCDGTKVRGNSKINNGEFRMINEILWNMWKAFPEKPDSDEYDTFNEEKPYNLPDLRGLFLMGASHGVNNYHKSVESAGVGQIGGSAKAGLKLSDLPKHYHRGNNTAGSTGSAGGGGQRRSWGHDETWATRDTDSKNSTGLNIRGFGITTPVGNKTEIEQEDIYTFATENPQTFHPNTPAFFAVNYYMRVRI